MELCVTRHLISTTKNIEFHAKCTMNYRFPQNHLPKLQFFTMTTTGGVINHLPNSEHPGSSGSLALGTDLNAAPNAESAAHGTEVDLWEGHQGKTSVPIIHHSWENHGIMTNDD